MRKIFTFVMSIALIFLIVSCGEKTTTKAIELMGAGDRIHDSFTFANLGVKIEETEENVYKISGSVEKIENEKIKEEFEIDSDVSHVVAIKLSANGNEVVKDKLKVIVDGVRNYDAEHLNGKDHTFIILEAKKGETVSIKVLWNGEDENSYVVRFDENLELK